MSELELVLGIVVAALAAHRAARAISTDTITDRARGYVYERAFKVPALLEPEPIDRLRLLREHDEAEAGLIPHPEERIAPDVQTTSAAWAYVYGFLTCPHCCGFWISIALWALWCNVDDLRVWIAAGAVAGLQSVISAKGMVASGS
jgi:hypothetical protein